MRTAKVGDYWRAVYRTSYPIRVDQLAFAEVVGIGSGTVKFSGGITAICGGNGVGKSTLLASLFHAVSALDGNGTAGARFAKATLVAQLVNNSDAVSIQTQFDPLSRDVKPAATGNVRITGLDPGRLSQQLSSFFKDTPDLHELLEPYTPRELTGEELETLNYVVGKSYTRCRITELADFEDKGDIPYFEVEQDNLTYGAEMMGLGELALHIILWQLSRLEKETVFLIEEPEAHVSPRSQQNLLNVIARDATRKKLWVVITTHSAGIVAKIPRAHIRLVFRSGAGIETIERPSEAQLNMVIGQVNVVRVIALTEDDVSTMFAREWLGRVAPEFVQQIDIRPAGSTSAIDTVVASFPGSTDSVRVLGLYDGDQRSKKKEWPHSHLPGSEPPERVLIAGIGDGVALAKATGREYTAVRFALDQLNGLDHHDFVRELAKQLGFTLEAMVAGLTEVWLGTAVGRAESDDAIQELKIASRLAL